MPRTSFLLSLLGGATLLVPLALLDGPARAHGIQSTLERISGLSGSIGAERLEIESSFSSGDPARDATVRLLPKEGGAPIELGRTGTDGRLLFVLPPIARNGGEIQVDAGPGHRDYLELSEIKPSRPGPTRQARNESPLGSWPWRASMALIGIGLVSGAGVFSLLRRDG